MRSNLPPKDLFLGKTISRFPKHVMQKHVASGNNGHLFYAFDESTNSELAFKIVPVDNLPRNSDDQDAYLNEAKKANLLEHPSVVQCVDVVPYVGPCSGSEEIGECVVFVYHYVKGKNLRAYMKEHHSDINLAFVEGFLRTMFELLYELQQRGEQHGDLHAGNVLVAKSEFDIYNRTHFRVTDFGVRKLTGYEAHASDYLAIAQTLRQLLECVEYRDSGESRDRYVFEILRHDFLERHLIETDTVADPFACNPRALLGKLNSLDDAYRVAAKAQTAAAKLVTPFDYPNCEQMGKSHLLLKSLYSDRVLGLSEIQARANLVLTGPRGCGKTTVFRALSLEYLLSTGDDHPDNINYIGIYYRCDDLYFSFPRYKRPDRSEAIDVPMHFLIVTLLATTLEQIGAWAMRYFAGEFKKKEESLIAALWDLLSGPLPTARVPISWRP